MRRTRFTDAKQLLSILNGVVAGANPDWYSRVHDDHDGLFTGYVTVCVQRDGDTHVQTGEHPSLRFRNHFGGGSSPRVHNALMILAHAIAADNADHPNGDLDKFAAAGPIPPTWYTRNEMHHYLTRAGCDDVLASSLADAYATNLQLAFDKGYQMSANRRALFAPRPLPMRTMVGDSMPDKPAPRPSFSDFKFQSIDPLTVEIDVTASAAYIRFAEGTVAQTVPIAAEACIAAVDLDTASHVLGLEVIGVDDYNVASIFRQVGFSPLSEDIVVRARYVPTGRTHFPMP